MSISSQSQVLKMKSISSNVLNIGNDIKAIGTTLGTSTDKSLQIAQAKLEEMSKTMEKISQDIIVYSQKIESATNQVNEMIRREEEKTVSV